MESGIGARIMRKTKRRYGCPVEFSIDLLSGKWKTVILSRLKLRPMRYGELREAIPALSDKILTERLRDLSEAGFIKQERSGGASRYCRSCREFCGDRRSQPRDFGLSPCPVDLADWMEGFHWV